MARDACCARVSRPLLVVDVVDCGICSDRDLKEEVCFWPWFCQLVVAGCSGFHHCNISNALFFVCLHHRYHPFIHSLCCFAISLPSSCLGYHFFKKLACLLLLSPSLMHFYLQRIVRHISSQRLCHHHLYIPFCLLSRVASVHWLSLRYHNLYVFPNQKVECLLGIDGV